MKERAVPKAITSVPSAGPLMAALEPLQKPIPLTVTKPATERPAGDSTSEASPVPVKAHEAVRKFLDKWKSAWEQKDLDNFIRMYDRHFQAGEKMDFRKWRSSKKRFFSKYRVIRVELSRVEIKPVKEGYEIRFIQSFRGDDYSDKGWKSMVLAGGKDKGFRITSEEWRPL